MKFKTSLNCAAITSILFVALPAMAATQIALSSAAPVVAEPGLTTVRLLGSGFPTGVTLNPANIKVQLAPQAGGAATIVTATQFQVVAGTLARVGFLVPASLSVGTPTVFTASLSDATDAFSSSNFAAFTVDPPASISLTSPSSAQQGQTINVTITGSYSNFLSGLSQVSAGLGVSVSGPSVASATTLTAQFTIAANAPLGPRTVTVTTGVETAALVGAFTVRQATVGVPNVAGQTQVAGTAAITGAGLVVGTVATAPNGSVAKGNVISESPIAGTSVNVGSAVNLVVSSGPAQVSVPNVVSQTQATAAKAITGAGLVVGTVTAAANGSVAKGNVISESPIAGTSVNVGWAVNLVVSSGPAQVSVPNVVSQTQATAATAITGAGLVVGTVTAAANGSVAKGNVISESPIAGTSVNVGSAVNLLVSSGPAQVSVPNVVSQTQATAATAITGTGLVVGTVTTATNGSVAKGSVISETPIAGTSVNVGSAVNLLVSSGPAQVSVPNVVSQTQATAATSITGAGLVVGTVTTAANGSVAKGNVISESPIAGTSVNVGSAVALVISTGPASVGPASVQVNLSAQVVAWAGNITVTPIALDGQGNAIDDPSLQFSIEIAAVGETSGSAPMISGNTITFPKLNKKVTNQNATLDPNGVYADTDPTDPNYGKQTGGVYLVTATLLGSNLTGSTQVVCLPTGTATVTAQTYNYAFQLNSVLKQIVAAYGNNGHSGLTNAKTALQNILSNAGFNMQVLSANQVLAPPDGAVITPDLLGGFPGSPDDAAYASTLTDLIAAVENATVQVNAITPANPTLAQVMAVQAALTTYTNTLTQFNVLKPSAVELATVNSEVNELLSTDIPTLLDAISSQVSATLGPLSGRLTNQKNGTFVMARTLSRMHLAPQFFDIFATMFSACVGLEGQALNNIITLTVALANDIVNLEAASVVNRNSPPGMSIDLITASASLSFACPSYPDTELDAFGLDSDPKNDLTLVVGAVNGGILGTIGSYSSPKGIGQIMSLLATIYQTGRDIGAALHYQVLLTPDQVALGGGLLGDGSDALIFNNGWPQVNQSPIPAVGLVIVTNKKAGGFAAKNIDVLGTCN